MIIRTFFVATTLLLGSGAAALATPLAGAAHSALPMRSGVEVVRHESGHHGGYGRYRERRHGMQHPARRYGGYGRERALRHGMPPGRHGGFERRGFYRHD